MMKKKCPYCKGNMKKGKIEGNTVYYCDKQLCVLKLIIDLDNPIPVGWIDR